MTVILTGGQSRRMGRDKALLETEDGAMSLALARRFTVLGPVAFSVDRSGRFPNGGFPELVDHYPGCGPINGIYSAFQDTDADYILLTGTDMPNGSPALAQELLAQIGGCSACVIRRKNGFLEPLFAVYHRSCLECVARHLRSGQNSLMQVLCQISVREISETVFPQWDLRQILWNLNTPQAYLQYCQANDLNLYSSKYNFR